MSGCNRPNLPSIGVASARMVRYASPIGRHTGEGLSVKVRETDFAKEVLIRKLHDQSALIGIIGLGYVGLPLVLRFAEVGFRVCGFDIDAKKVESLNAGRS